VDQKPHTIPVFTLTVDGDKSARLLTLLNYTHSQQTNTIITYVLLSTLA